MSEELVVRHCSPTLAGMKTGNMFSYTFSDVNELTKTLSRLNRKLVCKGIRVLPLKQEENKALIYVFRPERLMNDLNNDDACRLLRERGYCSCETPGKCIAQLRRRLNESPEFPHEIGLFLGYPPEDVCGFIENRAGGCKFAGFWKVYGNADAARRIFAGYKKCTRLYCEQWAKGRPLEHLAVAA